MEQTILYLIVGVLVFNYLLNLVLDYLNHNHATKPLPDNVKGVYDEEEYRKSMDYKSAQYRFGLVSGLFSILLVLFVFLSGALNFIDVYIRFLVKDEIAVSLVYFGVLFLTSDILQIPFSLYSTFVIEEKYGFNKTTVRTFILDKIKSYLLMILLGGGILYLIIFIYQELTDSFWLLAWGVLALISIFAMMFYAQWILPLFNKLKPMEEGSLRSEIQKYCDAVGYTLSNLFIMDGSKRSTKANAFFSGLGAKKRIVLYDTLVEKLSESEIVAVLAHEIGHFKKKHTLTSLVISLLQSALMFYILGLFLSTEEVSKAVGVEQHSFHIGALVFFVLYSPVSSLLGIVNSIWSRKNEYEADNYAKETADGEALSSALIKLSKDSLSNLNPHPAYVFMHYSHPTLSDRLKNLGKGG